MTITLLPGAPTDLEPPSPPPIRRGPDRRIVAAVVAAAVAAGGVFAWTQLGGSGSGPAPAPVAHTAPVHHGAPAQPADLRLPATGTLTTAQQLRAATAVFGVLDVQFAGWTKAGKVKVDTSKPDAVDRAVSRCTGSGPQPASVVSPGYERPATAAAGILQFFPSHAAAVKDLASATSRRVQACIRSATIGKTQAAFGGTIRTTGMQMLNLGIPGAVAIQFDGVLTKSGQEPTAVRIVNTAAAVGRAEVEFTSIGFGSALPLSADRMALVALVAKARTVVR